MLQQPAYTKVEICKIQVLSTLMFLLSLFFLLILMFPVRLFIRQVLKHLQELDQCLETKLHENTWKSTKIL